MKTSKVTIFTIVSLCLLACFAVSATGQTSSQTGQSTIRGRAIFDDTDRPVRRARVMLFTENGSGQSRTSITDREGEFIFKKVPAGRYRIWVDFPGALDDSSGSWLQTDEKQQSTTVAVDGASNAEVKVRVIRGAAITGKVTYPDGEPVTSAQVSVFVKVGKNWTHASISPLGAHTDDRGIYRLYSLPEGEYIVSVIEQGLSIEERDGSTIQSVVNQSLNPYFYPDASSFNTAGVLRVETGKELNNINFTLVERPTYKISGIVTLRDKPLADVHLSLERRGETSRPTESWQYGMSTQANQEGQWIFTDVPDGNYEIMLDSLSSQVNETFTMNGVRVKMPGFVNQRKQVTVTGSDLSEVVIALSEGGRISGSISVEGDKPLPPSLQLFSKLQTSGRRMAGTTVGPEDKGTFSVEGASPGENVLFLGGLGSSYFVKSMTWKDRDLLRQTVLIEDGVEIKGVRIVLSTEVGTLKGILLSEDKKAFANRMFVLMPVDQTRWSYRNESNLSAITDNSGKFVITGAPGEYVVFVTPARGNPFPTLDGLKKLASKAPRVVLRTGDQREVEIIAGVADP